MNAALNSGAFALFEKGLLIEEVASKLDRASSTVETYLSCYLKKQGASDPSPWVDQPTVELIEAACIELGLERLKPIYLKLDEKVSYGQIKIVIQCMENA